MVMKRDKLLVIAGVLTTIGLLLASCGPAAKEPAAGEQPGGETPAAEQPVAEQPGTGTVEKGLFRAATNIMGARQAMDPVNTHQMTFNPIKNMVYDSLVHYGGPVLSYEPAIAKSWTIASDWSKIDFYLDERAKFQNGDPVTAEDVKFTLDLYRAPKALNSYSPELRENVKDVQVVDDYHVVVLLNKPYAAFLDRCLDRLGIIPKGYSEKVGYPDGFAAKPIGAGPFKVISFKQDQFLNVEAVPDHYRHTAYVKKISYVYAPEAMTRFAMLKAGEIDFMIVEPTFVPDVNKDPNLSLRWAKYGSLNSLGYLDMAYPKEPSPWQDIRLRQAGGYAIDRKTMCEKIFNNCYEPWGQFLAPYHPGYDPTAQPLPYDPVKAKQLLAEAGYPNGIDVIFPCANSSRYIAEPVSFYLNEVGIRAKLQVYEDATYDRKVFAPELHGIALLGAGLWTGMGHPGVGNYSMLGGGAYSCAGVVNPEVKAIILDSFNYAVGDPKLAELARKVSDLSLKDGYRQILWTVNTAFAIGPRVLEWEDVAGKPQPFRFEYLKLKD
ncbi:MAG: ABC transporter substrate-binding protein [Chloroflexota bacterium]